MRSGIQVLLAHPGTQYAAYLARQLSRSDRLHRFWTGFAISKQRAERWRQIFPQLMRNLDNRIVDIPSQQLRTLPRLEFASLFRLRRGGDAQRILHRRNADFQRAIPRSEIEKSAVGIGFDTSSDILMERFHQSRKPFVLDQTIAHAGAKRRVYETIAHRYPEWGSDIEERVPEVTSAEAVEHARADRIVVASAFTKRTLLEQGVPEERISVIPYGVDLDRFRGKQTSPASRRFRFLFAGLVSARKGVPLLLEAWRRLNANDAELWIAGPLSKGVPSDWVGGTPHVKFLGKIPNAQLAEIMSASDVFVFPSYFEGFGLVILEAMASGLPVITTTNTGGPDILTEGSDGWVIEPGDIERLADAMRFCCENRETVREMGSHARETAQRFSWDAYGDRWVKLLRETWG